MAKKRTPRESRYVTVARIAYRLTQKALPLYAHRNSPKRYTQPQLAACVLLAFYLDVSYRDMEEWLLASDQVCGVLGLRAVPDHTTLYRMYQRLRMPQLEAMNRALLTALAVEEESLAFDSTGFAPTQASQHYLSAGGRRCRTFIKGFYVVGTASQLIVAWRYDRGPNSDMDWLDRLRHSAHRYGRRAANGHARYFVLADKAFDGAQARPTDLIPPRRGQKRIVRPDRLERAARTDMARLDGLYGQRWKVETVHSVIKRLSGDTIRSRKRLHQRREVAIKGLVYNIHR
jgi:hypothetical protein